MLGPRATSRLVALTAAIAALCGTSPGTASAASTTYIKILNEYSQTGVIQPCQFTSAQLNEALKSVDLYGQAYVADFPNAIQAALNNRASGGCNRTRLSRSGLSNVEAVLAGAGSAGGGPSAGLQPGPLTAATDAPLPAPILIMAVLAGAFALLAAATALSRARGWDPAWAATVRHSLAEAGYRLGGAFEGIRDRRP
jgi:hypothetical protein